MMARAPRTVPPSGSAATRLLVGSHLLLLVQSLLMLASPAGLTPPRPGVAAICLLALVCLALAAVDRRSERDTSTRRPPHAA